MRILPAWLREFVNVAADDRQLAEDLTSAGIAVESVQEEHGATIYEMDLTTNRVDAMNHYGVAREASAIYDVELKKIEPKLPLPQIPRSGGQAAAFARDDNRFSHRHRGCRGLRAIHGAHCPQREDRAVAAARCQAARTCSARAPSTTSPTPRTMRSTNWDILRTPSISTCWKAARSSCAAPAPAKC